MDIDTLSPKKSDFLKIIAIITMLIDHIGAILVPINAESYYPLRVIGRVAFPIFAYQVAVGYVHTRSFTKYLSRLIIFALISQIPFYLAFYSNDLKSTYLSHLNIFFILALGLLAMYCYDLIGKNKFCKKFYINFIPVILFAVIAEIFRADYGAYGVLMIFICYMFRFQPAFALIGQLFLAFCFITVNPHSPGRLIQIFCLWGFFVIYMPFLKKDSYPIVKMNKYIFYSFYPLHLLILYYIKTLF